MRSMKPDELVYNSARERKRVREGGALSISLSLMIIKAWRDEISLMEDNIPASVSCYYSIFRVKGSARLKPKISLAYYHPLPCYYVAGRQATAEARIIDKGDTMMERRTRKKGKKKIQEKGRRERMELYGEYGQKKRVNVPFGLPMGERGELIIDFSETMSFLRSPFIAERLAPTDFPRSVIGFINCPLIENSE